MPFVLYAACKPFSNLLNAFSYFVASLSQPLKSPTTLRTTSALRSCSQWLATFEADGLPATESAEWMESALSANCFTLKQVLEDGREWLARSSQVQKLPPKQLVCG